MEALKALVKKKMGGACRKKIPLRKRWCGIQKTGLDVVRRCCGGGFEHSPFIFRVKKHIKKAILFASL